ANDVKYTLIVAAFSMWVFRIGFSYVLGDWLEMGLFGVWVAMTIDWAFRGLLFTVRYLRGGWEKKAVPDLAEI
ncbi:MAG: MATE family efflux transporter, partial [Firmicutes bacterium]|nr:MATE family efflux transporter [Bacillota bacterium]